MRIYYSENAEAKPTDAEITRALESVSRDFLRRVVETISIPRHYSNEYQNNQFTARWIAEQLQSYGYHSFFQGRYKNVVSVLPGSNGGPMFLIGAHYDSVPGTPGADDNASAVAALLACAKAICHYEEEAHVCFVAFNREEDGMMGSWDFVTNYLPKSGLIIRQVHILEMVGYCSRTPGSQHLPPGMPIKIPEVGDFLGLIGNRRSNALIDGILEQSKSYIPGFPVLGLKVYHGLEKFFPHLRRSDHNPFWKTGVPALMWTDTSEFRNPNYHQWSDSPDTLDYIFLRRVTQLLLLQALLFCRLKTTRANFYTGNRENICLLV
ncbi:MAG: M28 family peptidase [Candidatus Aminicenantes bacterium]|nr:MAG: M28 family peptidase [Candidatus Aminicenantes bacterium]